MKKIFKFIKIIILIILVLVLFILGFYKKSTKEGFHQNIARIMTKFFNIDYDYYGLTKEEASDEKSQIDPDKIILDIGSSFGEVDYKRIPWDAENRQLSMSEALWGVVPTQAQTALFRKLYLASQLQDITSLPFDDAANQFHYEDPIFQFGTDDPELAAGLQAASALTTLTVPMIIGVLGANDAEDAIRKRLENAISQRSQQVKGSAIRNVSMSSKIVTSDVINKNKFKMNSIFDKNGKGFEPDPDVKIRAFNSARPKNLFEKGKLTDPGSLKFVNIQERIIRNPSFGKRVKNMIKAVFVNKVTKIIFKAIMFKFAILTSLAWIPVIGPTIDSIYNFVLTPMLIILTLPGPTGVVSQAMERMADPEGCCPPGTKPLDQVIPQGAMIALSFIPVFGDILDLFYPYVCQDEFGGLIMKSKYYNTPRWITYSWLSCHFFDWPPFNCRLGLAKMQGKYLTSETQVTGTANYHQLTKSRLTDTNLDTSTEIRDPTYIWGVSGVTNNLANIAQQGLYYFLGGDRPTSYSAPYTNLDDVARNHTDYKFTNVVLKAFNKETKDYYILDQTSKFYFIDFSDPNILIQMAQFYYNFATTNPFPADDGSINYSYISKINFVIASSLFTCDVLCELTNVKYFLNNPSDLTETITFNHDRRFYFSCDQNNNPPSYWENIANSRWKTFDDAYDAALFRLNDYISPEHFKNDYFNGDMFVTAYEIRDRAYKRFISLSNSGNINSADLSVFNDDYNASDLNYKAFMDDIKQKNSSSLTLQQSNTISYLCSNVVKAKEDLWEYQKSITTIDLNYVHPQYKLYGCTRLDATAGSVLEPVVVNFEVDYRKKVDFDVTPHLKRCGNLHITTRQCIDLSNVIFVVEKYKEKYPNVNINTIHSIKAKGKNTCQFVWDQQIAGQANITRVSNNIVYQQDLSSCAFRLPRNLVGTNVGTNVSGTLTQDPNTTMFVGSISPNPVLTYTPASYIPPLVTTLPSGMKKLSFPSANRVTDGEEIPRFDFTTGARLPDLIRPKKPIRITYPQQPEANLGNQSNNYCGNEETQKKFILDYNASNTDKILKIVRTFTTSSNVCDMEVDVLGGTGINRTVQRKTVSYKMKEGFQNRFTYDSINNTNGLNIKKNTEYKNGSNFKGLYSEAYLADFTPSVIPNVTFFNDSLVTQFTSTTREIATSANNMLINLIGTQNLGNNAACGKCSDEDIQQRILEQYNLDNVDFGRYDVYKNRIRAIFKSAPFDADTCHVYFAQNEDHYVDRFALNLNSPSNYRLRDLPVGLAKIKMMRDTTASVCTYKPIPRQEYLDISASDPSLQTGVDLKNTTNFFYSKRQVCDNLICTNRTLFNQASNDFHRKTRHRIRNVSAMMKTNPDTCDYLIQFFYNDGINASQNPDGSPLDISGVLRVRYEYPVYRTTDPACGPFTFSSNNSIFVNNLQKLTFKSNNLELQFGGSLDIKDPDISPLLSYNPTRLSDPMNRIVKNTFT